MSFRLRKLFILVILYYLSMLNVKSVKVSYYIIVI